jgi:multidrug resistance efflux pump
LKRWGIRIGLPLIAVIILLQLFGGSEETRASGATYTVARGHLPITVVEGGSAESLEPHHINCEVKGRRVQVKILYLIEEGYRVTREDVESKKILVELDASELEERIKEQEVQFQRAVAQLAEARQKLAIQRETNNAEIATAEREVKFTAMDLQKYVGEDIANELIEVLQIRRQAIRAADTAREAAMEANRLLGVSEEARATADEATKEAEEAAANVEEPIEPELDTEVGTSDSIVLEAVEGEAPSHPEPTDESSPEYLAKTAQELVEKADAAHKTYEAAVAEVETASDDLRAAALDAGTTWEDRPNVLERFELTFATIPFEDMSSDTRLGGEAQQQASELETEIIMEKEELSTALKQLDGTKRLFAKDYASEQELTADEMAVKRRQNNVKSNETSRELFFRYEFPKTAEETFSKHEEALSKFDRVQKEAETKLVNARVSVQAAEAEYTEEEKGREENLEQIEKCKIYASHEGLVVYGDGNSNRYWGGEPIREGSVVRERQTILTIPDITKMAIKVQIHESDIKKVSVGQKTAIRVEAFPDEVIEGEVTKVSVLPSSENRWLNPDLKIYETTISVEGVYEWLKPGMTAEVEIDVKTLDDVLYVPLQAVSSWKGERVCYLQNEERRTVETGEFNDKYIEIKSGLSEGDSIFLRSLVDEDTDEDMEDVVEEPEESESSELAQAEASSGKSG